MVLASIALAATIVTIGHKKDDSPDSKGRSYKSRTQKHSRNSAFSRTTAEYDDASSVWAPDNGFMSNDIIRKASPTPVGSLGSQFLWDELDLSDEFNGGAGAGLSMRYPFIKKETMKFSIDKKFCVLTVILWYTHRVLCGCSYCSSLGYSMGSLGGPCSCGI